MRIPTKLIPTEKYLNDAARYIGDDDTKSEWRAHRRLLRRLASEDFGPLPEPHGISRRESVDAERFLWVSARVVPHAGVENVVELRGLRVQRKDAAIL